MEKYEVVGVKPGDFQFAGIHYNHANLSETDCEKLISAGYPHLQKRIVKKVVLSPTKATES